MPTQNPAKTSPTRRNLLNADVFFFFGAMANRETCNCVGETETLTQKPPAARAKQFRIAQFKGAPWLNMATENEREAALKASAENWEFHLVPVSILANCISSIFQ